MAAPMIKALSNHLSAFSDEEVAGVMSLVTYEVINRFGPDATENYISDLLDAYNHEMDKQNKDSSTSL